MQRLLVIIPDRLSGLVEKGEITPRYYNPGNLFDEVHILMTNDDAVDAESVRAAAGDAKMFIHNLPAGKGLFVRSLGWRPALLNGWADGAVALAEKIKPSMVRCHGNFLNAYAAFKIKEKLGIPYAVSLHTNPDTDMRGTETNFRERVYNLARISVEGIAVRNADAVMPVYADILPYTRRLGARNVEVAYNALNGDNIRVKRDYALGNPVRIVSTGRQFKEKNPENIVRAMESVPNATLTLVGNGDYHERLKKAASECAASDRIEFIPAMPNVALCARLADYDIFATHSDYWGIPKAVMETLLAGLPAVMNKCAVAPVTEFQNGIVELVDNTVEGYAAAINRLIADDAYRESLGRKALRLANELWAPESAEKKFVEIYRRIMKPPAA